MKRPLILIEAVTNGFILTAFSPDIEGQIIDLRVATSTANYDNCGVNEQVKDIYTSYDAAQLKRALEETDAKIAAEFVTTEEYEDDIPF